MKYEIIVCFKTFIIYFCYLIIYLSSFLFCVKFNMPLTNERIYNYDRFVPPRSLIDFEAAYYNIFYKDLDVENQMGNSLTSSTMKKQEFRANLEKIANLNQRLFKMSQHPYKITRGVDEQIWPCYPRKKPILATERVLDLPQFNREFHLANTMDWGPNNLISISVMNRIVIGGGFSEKNIATKTVTEFENDIGTAVSWSRNGLLLAIGTEQGRIQIWYVERKKLLLDEKCCEQNCTVTALQWHPSHECLAWACSKGKITRSDFRNNLSTFIKFAHDGCICNLKYSPRANYLCSSGQDGYVRIWRGDNCEPYMEIETSNPVRAIAWHPWRSGILAIGEGLPAAGSLSIWNINTAKMLYMVKPQKPVAIKALEFNKITGELVCSQWVQADEKEYCEVLVLGGPNQVVDFVTETSACVTALMWSPDGTKLGLAGSDETFKIMKFYKRTGKISRKRNENHGIMAFNPLHLTVR